MEYNDLTPEQQKAVRDAAAAFQTDVPQVLAAISQLYAVFQVTELIATRKAEYEQQRRAWAQDAALEYPATAHEIVGLLSRFDDDKERVSHILHLAHKYSVSVHEVAEMFDTLKGDVALIYERLERRADLERLRQDWERITPTDSLSARVRYKVAGGDNG